MTRYQPSVDMRVEDVSGMDIETIFFEAMVHEGARNAGARMSGVEMDAHDVGCNLRNSCLLGLSPDGFRNYSI